MSSSACERMRRSRERARDGKRVFHLALDVVAIERLLEHEHLLDPLAEHDDREVDGALAQFIGALAELVSE